MPFRLQARIAFVLFLMAWVEFVARQPDVVQALEGEAQVVESDLSGVVTSMQEGIVLDSSTVHGHQYVGVEYRGGITCETRQVPDAHDGHDAAPAGTVTPGRTPTPVATEEDCNSPLFDPFLGQ